MAGATNVKKIITEDLSLLDSFFRLHAAYPEAFTVSLTPGLKRIFAIMLKKTVARLHARPNCFSISPLFFIVILFCLSNEGFSWT